MIFAPLLQPAPPLPVPPQQLDVVDRRLQDAPLVLPHVSHLLILISKPTQDITHIPSSGAPHIIVITTITTTTTITTIATITTITTIPYQFIIGLILGWEQCAELFDPIVDVEPASSLNW